ncbi:MAG: sigma-54 dependent transcriptional regulator [Chloracidobacterium sp.]|nr:sigma-54 dependent transcriptional regulator [Chloracidobacterium sp.]MDW8218625.1 sigma-54 dependent transcriptional regulator [Acidobacteriota bacterium]
MTKRILVVDDDAASCELLREIFAARGWETTTATTPAAARSSFAKQSFDLVVSDINLEADATGLDLLKDFRARCPVVLVTGFGTLDAAVAATRDGAWDFISKPFKVEEVIAAAQAAFTRTTETPPPTPAAVMDTSGMVGRSALMVALYKEIARVAPTRSTVLIIGESGSGKELVARAIHRHSRRAEGPFVPVNCGALPEHLLEAELFGHVRGAFTGAVADRKGLWEEADGGTLFLDEIGDIPLSMQVKLLRALQEGEVRRVGAARSRQVDVRVVAATNRNLEADVAAGRFREDLYYRLSAVTLRVPPLRQRREDVPLLAEAFLQSAAQSLGRGLRLAPETLAALAAYDFPGNVRELQAAVEYAALHARGGVIRPEDLPLKLQTAEVRSEALPAPTRSASDFADLPTLDELERRYLLYVLETVKGNRTRAAEILGIDRRTLYRMAERFGIKLTDDV